jgi:hypothetical protein
MTHNEQGINMAKTPEERRKMMRKAASKLAETQGLAWKELPKEKKKELKQQVRTGRKEKRAAKKAGSAAGA